MVTSRQKFTLYENSQKSLVTEDYLLNGQFGLNWVIYGILDF